MIIIAEVFLILLILKLIIVKELILRIDDDDKKYLHTAHCRIFGSVLFYALKKMVLNDTPVLSYTINIEKG